ncbi:MAG: 30S ribosomal protein THX [Pyrinomonadaceae bacterium]
MGKGDKRTRRGKIFAGSFGKTRLKKKKVTVKPVEVKPAKATKKSK